MSDDAPAAKVPETLPATSPATLGGILGPEEMADRAGREPGELALALSPRQIIGGFALLAGLIVWLGRRSRRKG
jgi:hypothetical protein